MTPRSAHHFHVSSFKHMRIEGTLTKWNDERGFGFISPTKGGSPEVFVHISAFPRDGQRPSVGELLTFEIETDKDGKKKATNLLFPNREIRLPRRRSEPSGWRERLSFLGLIVLFALIVALAFYGYGKYVHRHAAQENISVPQKNISAPQKAAAVHSNENTASSTFQCDGRTYCSQMTSCAEATFFLKNCPDVKMDGNHDGVPCEQQWCN